jgi:hypothetical protein
MYVTNAAALSQPNLDKGIFGVLTVNGERIMYRTRDVVTNTVSGLIRGTAGTGAAEHAVDALVYDTGRGNLLNQDYQDYVVSNSDLGDGTTTIFYAPNIVLSDSGDSSTTSAESIEVYVGGVRQYAYSDTTASSQYRWFVTDFSPLAVDFVVDLFLKYSEELEFSLSNLRLIFFLHHFGRTWNKLNSNLPFEGPLTLDQRFGHRILNRFTHTRYCQ